MSSTSYYMFTGISDVRDILSTEIPKFFGSLREQYIKAIIESSIEIAPEYNYDPIAVTKFLNDNVYITVTKGGRIIGIIPYDIDDHDDNEIAELAESLSDSLITLKLGEISIDEWKKMRVTTVPKTSNVHQKKS